MNTRQLPTIAAAVLIAGAATLFADATPARAATITSSYASGHLDAIVNGYGTDGLGMFELDTGAGSERAWCIEADVSHSRSAGAYSAVDPQLDSPVLDALVWILARMDHVDDDTAAAGAALAWYHAGARRSAGPLVWSDGARGFAPISPLDPVPWDALPPLTITSPVGLRAGGIELDAAERRVAELHRAASARRGPWALVSGAVPGEFVVSGPAGPIDGVDIRVTLQAPGHPDTISDLRTDADGSVRIDLPVLPAGGRVTAQVESPGVHREWDGPGATQRMVTATTAVLTAATELPPAPRHVEIRKSSADPTLSVAGAEFELRDATGRVVDRERTDADGRLRFDPVEPATHPGPYRIVETVPPPGLLIVDPIVVDDASTDPAAPTVVPIVDPPALVGLVVEKRLSIPDSGPGDRSGFEFGLVRRSDGLERRVVTGPDGRTRPVGVTLGEYEICELSRPEWASGTVDPGCRSVAIGVAELSSDATVSVDYVNEVPPPRIETRAADLADGDQQLPPGGGTAVDRVRLDGLVPGTSYLLVGQLLTADGEATGVHGSMTVEASASTAEVELVLDATGLDAGRYVIVDRLEIVSAGSPVVAVHHDLGDEDQMLTVPPPPTTTTTSTTTTSTSTTTTSTTAPPTTLASTTTDPTPDTTTDTTTPTRPTLPRTGVDGTVGTVLRIGDLVFVAGIGLAALAGLVPRRQRHQHRP